MADFPAGIGGATASIQSEIAITPSDTTVFAASRGLYIDVAGAIKYVTANGETVTKTNLVAGVWHPIRVTKVFATGTAATGIFAGY